MEPELIVKQEFVVDCRGDRAYAVPDIVVLGNREGFRWLGEWLIKLSQSVPNPAHADWDPEDHQHLTSEFPPSNSKLSDEVEFRFGLINEINRETVLKKYDINEDSRRSGDLAIRYRRQAQEAEVKCDEANRVLTSNAKKQ